MNVIEAFMGLALVAVVMGFAVSMTAMILSEMDESPIRRWRKLHTPPCRLCAHYVKDGYAECTCPAAVLRKEKLRGLTCTKVRSDDVRGTRVCRFEPKGDEE
ncbi:hypothetical protein [Slackia piriformis]|uniref:hypothetical protein n=1 Tax=Slackia piriformis TaxID=626934 RepID=UPI0023EFE840|nr:hypothetical protein [Slackia piriformis]